MTTDRPLGSRGSHPPVPAPGSLLFPLTHQHPLHSGGPCSQLPLRSTPPIVIQGHDRLGSTAWQDRRVDRQTQQMGSEERTGGGVRGAWGSKGSPHPGEGTGALRVFGPVRV